MEEYTVVMNRRINIIKKARSTQSNLQIQYNPYQKPLVFFTEQKK